MVSNHAPFAASTVAPAWAPNRRYAERRPSFSPCWILHGEQILTAKVSNISASGAYLETVHIIPLGETIVLRHPSAGQIEAHVVRHGAEGIGVAFHLSEASVGFTLRAVTADMTMSQPLQTA
jgi:PilZ domain